MKTFEAIELVLELAYDRLEEFRNFNDLTEDHLAEYEEATRIVEFLAENFTKGD